MSEPLQKEERFAGIVEKGAICSMKPDIMPLLRAKDTNVIMPNAFSEKLFVEPIFSIEKNP